MTSIARSNRYHIAIFGRRNAGKSSLVNCIAGQAVSIVSDVAGTTTDTVWKSIELPGVGAAVIADTAGFDDEGELGAMRVDAARKVLARADVAILLLGECDGDASFEKEWLAQMREQQLPVIVVAGKCDKQGCAERVAKWQAALGGDVFQFSTVTGEGRTGDRFMTLLKNGQISNCCLPNALITLKEYLQDYASPATREKGEAMIERLLSGIPNDCARAKAAEYLDRIDNDERDFRF